MLSILFASANTDNLAEFADFFRQSDKFAIIEASSAKNALRILGEKTLSAAIIDQELTDGSGLSLAQQLAKRFPLLNCALVSPLSPDDFHEATEGLGLFMQIPPTAGKPEAKKMVEILTSIDRLLLS